MHLLYILQSLRDERLYVGMTQNIQKRLAAHNAGRVRSTKGRRPLVLVYTEEYQTRSDARDREKFLKSYAGSKTKLSIVESIRGPIV